MRNIIVKTAKFYIVLSVYLLIANIYTYVKVILIFVDKKPKTNI